ncbi:hypothetical protein HZB02_00480 [Candidatus Woesearchaeota archaeon]|nr:hypothetical protein [Candidatus Woesearchaeota archaeon]
MNIVVDLNIILSALLRDSLTREILVRSNLSFCFPEASLHKIRKYEPYILQKSGLSEAELSSLLSLLFVHIQLISDEVLLPYWPEAKSAMELIDSEDVVFIAAALSIDGTIWSEDKDFR